MKKKTVWSDWFVFCGLWLISLASRKHAAEFMVKMGRAIQDAEEQRMGIGSTLTP
jgi:hypothetical protein